MESDTNVHLQEYEERESLNDINQSNTLNDKMDKEKEFAVGAENQDKELSFVSSVDESEKFEENSDTSALMKLAEIACNTTESKDVFTEECKNLTSGVSISKEHSAKERHEESDINISDTEEIGESVLDSGVFKESLSLLEDSKGTSDRSKVKENSEFALSSTNKCHEMAKTGDDEENIELNDNDESADILTLAKDSCESDICQGDELKILPQEKTDGTETLQMGSVEKNVDENDDESYSRKETSSEKIHSEENSKSSDYIISDENIRLSSNENDNLEAGKQSLENVNTAEVGVCFDGKNAIEGDSKGLNESVKEGDTLSLAECSKSDVSCSSESILNAPQLSKVMENLSEVNNVNQPPIYPVEKDASFDEQKEDFNKERPSKKLNEDIISAEIIGDGLLCSEKFREKDALVSDHVEKVEDSSVLEKLTEKDHLLEDENMKDKESCSVVADIQEKDSPIIENIEQEDSATSENTKENRDSLIRENIVKEVSLIPEDIKEKEDSSLFENIKDNEAFLNTTNINSPFKNIKENVLQSEKRFNDSSLPDEPKESLGHTCQDVPETDFGTKPSDKFSQKLNEDAVEKSEACYKIFESRNAEKLKENNSSPAENMDLGTYVSNKDNACTISSSQDLNIEAENSYTKSNNNQPTDDQRNIHPILEGPRTNDEPTNESVNIVNSKLDAENLNLEKNNSDTNLLKNASDDNSVGENKTWEETPPISDENTESKSLSETLTTSEIRSDTEKQTSNQNFVLGDRSEDREITNTEKETSNQDIVLSDRIENREITNAEKETSDQNFVLGDRSEDKEITDTEKETSNQDIVLSDRIENREITNAEKETSDQNFVLGDRSEDKEITDTEKETSNQDIVLSDRSEDKEITDTEKETSNQDIVLSDRSEDKEITDTEKETSNQDIVLSDRSEDKEIADTEKETSNQDIVLSDRSEDKEITDREKETSNQDIVLSDRSEDKEITDREKETSNQDIVLSDRSEDKEITDTEKETSHQDIVLNDGNNDKEITDTEKETSNQNFVLGDRSEDKEITDTEKETSHQDILLSDGNNDREITDTEKETSNQNSVLGDRSENKEIIDTKKETFIQNSVLSNSSESREIADTEKVTSNQDFVLSDTPKTVQKIDSNFENTSSLNNLAGNTTSEIDTEKRNVSQQNKDFYNESKTIEALTENSEEQLLLRDDSVNITDKISDVTEKSSEDHKIKGTEKSDEKNSSLISELPNPNEGLANKDSEQTSTQNLSSEAFSKTLNSENASDKIIVSESSESVCQDSHTFTSIASTTDSEPFKRTENKESSETSSISDKLLIELEVPVENSNTQLETGDKDFATNEDKNTSDSNDFMAEKESSVVKEAKAVNKNSDKILTTDIQEISHKSLVMSDKSNKKDLLKEDSNLSPTNLPEGEMHKDISNNKMVLVQDTSKDSGDLIIKGDDKSSEEKTKKVESASVKAKESSKISDKTLNQAPESCKIFVRKDLTENLNSEESLSASSTSSVCDSKSKQVVSESLCKRPSKLSQKRSSSESLENLPCSKRMAKDKTSKGEVTDESDIDEEDKLVIDEDVGLKSNKELLKKRAMKQYNAPKSNSCKGEVNSGTDKESSMIKKPLDTSKSPPRSDKQNKSDQEDCLSTLISTKSNVCEKCKQIWNDNTLKMLFEGNESVTINSRISYGAIICMNVYVAIHYPNFKERALRGLLDRADLAKNLGSIKVSILNNWLVALIKNKKISCCSPFRPIYRVKSHSLKSSNKEKTQNSNKETDKQTSNSSTVQKGPSQQKVPHDNESTLHNSKSLSSDSSSSSSEVGKQLRSQQSSHPGMLLVHDEEKKNNTSTINLRETSARCKKSNSEAPVISYSSDSNEAFYQDVTPSTLMEIRSSAVGGNGNKATITNGNIYNTVLSKSKHNPALQNLVLKEKENLDTSLHPLYDKLACNTKLTETETKYGKRKCFTNKEVLNIHSVCILESKSVNLNNYFKLFLQILHHREYTIFIPDGKTLVKYVENLRREDNRHKWNVNKTKQFRQNQWDNEALYSSSFSENIEKSGDGYPTIREILTVFCIWKNQALLKKQNQEMDLASEISSLFDNKVRIEDCLGLCVRLYSTYCHLMFDEEKSDITKAKLFLNLCYFPKKEQDLQKNTTTFNSSLSFLLDTQRDLSNTITYLEDQTREEIHQRAKRSFSETIIDCKLDQTKKLKTELLKDIKSPSVVSLLNSYVRLKNELNFFEGNIDTSDSTLALFSEQTVSYTPEMKLMVAKLRAGNVPIEVIPSVIEKVFKNILKRKIPSILSSSPY